MSMSVTPISGSLKIWNQRKLCEPTEIFLRNANPALFQIPSPPSTSIYLKNVQGAQIIVRGIRPGTGVIIYGRGIEAELYRSAVIMSTYVASDGVIHVMEYFME